MNILLPYSSVPKQLLLDQPTHGVINNTTDIQGIIINNQQSNQVDETLSFKLLQGYPFPAQFYAQYSLEKELGSGGFGFVVLVKEKVTGQELAVKLIYKNKLPASSWITTQQGQYLPLEIYILQHVHHRTIVDYVDNFEDDIFFYLVMEFHGSPWQRSSTSSSSSLSPPCAPALSPSSEPSSDNGDGLEDAGQQYPGQKDDSDTIGRRYGSCDLFECIEQHHILDESLAKLIFQQIIECVAYLDTVGICHRDLKDENFVIDRNYKVKLIDFGSSILLPRYFDSGNDNKAKMMQSQPFYGTLAYAAPEVLRSEPYQAESAEVWSMGVLLYMLIFAQVPFTNPRMVLAAHVPLPSSSTTRVSSSCLHLISWLLEKLPTRRPTVHQVLAHPWLQQD